MNLEQVIEFLQRSPGFQGQVTHWEKIPPKEASFGPFPERLDPRLLDGLKSRNIHKLYTHQSEAIDQILDGKNVTIVTPTASGKTLCYNLPVLDAVMENPENRALYLFPTKALSQDQVTELHDLVDILKIDIKTYTFDGDTPVSARKAIRMVGHIVVTNPDMLHQGILPGCVRQPPGKFDPPSETDLRVLQCLSPVHRMFGHDCQSQRTF